MKVSTKVAAGFALHVVILIGLLVYHVHTIREAADTSQALPQVSERQAISSSQLRLHLRGLAENAAKYNAPDPELANERYLERFNELLVEFENDLNVLHEDPELSDRERVEVQRLYQGWNEFRPVADGLAGMLRGPRADNGQDPLQPLYDRLDQLGELANAVSDASAVVMDERLQSSANAQKDAERLAWIAATGALLLSIIVSVFIVRFISASLNRLKEGTRQVAEGRFGYRLDVGSGDEFADVARDFNTMTERLGELDQMKRDFVSKVSHDLKTPLASMQEIVDVLLDEVPGELTEKQQRLLRLNHQSGKRLSSMITKLLDLSSLGAAGLQPELAAHEVGPLIQRAVDQVGAARMERGLELVLDVPNETILLECDGERVLQVIDNLLENAVKFSKDNASVHAGVRFLSKRPDDVPIEHWPASAQADSAPGYVLFTVTDRGPGVPDEQKERIFERFFQSEAGRNVRGRGVGLGLTICREIAAAHGGAIWVIDNPGGGSIFHMLLPGALRVSRETAFATTASSGNEQYEIHES